ncbi:MAG: IclR family transcriptional regulator [Pseudomonadota bacterium]
MAASIQGAQSFGRSIQVLQLIADAGRPLSRVDLADMCDLTRPTLYRIIASLEAEGLIEICGQNSYRLGARLVALARTALSQSDLRHEAGPELERLRDVTGETVHLAVPSGGVMVYIDKIESREVVRMMSTVGTQVPFYSTSVGKAYLSALPPEEAAAMIDRLDRPALTAFTVTEADALKAQVDEARGLGFAREEQENEPGIVCFGAPVRDDRGKPVGAISVSVPMFRLEDAKRYAEAVSASAKSVSKQIGYPGR